MMRTTLPFLVLCACAAAPDVAAYQQSLAALEATVTTHQTDSASATAEACAAEHQRYDDLMRPGLAELTNLSSELDDCQRAMRPMRASMRDRCGSMMTELNRHAGAACSGDADNNHAEAAQHCQRMRDWLSQQRTQAASLSNGRCSP